MDDENNKKPPLRKGIYGMRKDAADLASLLQSEPFEKAVSKFSIKKSKIDKSKEEQSPSKGPPITR